MNKKLTSSVKSSHIKDIALLFLAPIIVIVVALLAVYIPSLAAKPQYDFLYSVCSDYSCRNELVVKNSEIISVAQSTNADISYSNQIPTATLRYYDVKKDSHREISIADSKKYTLDDASKSPDGYTITRQASSDGFLLWGSYSEGWMLKNGLKKKNIDVGDFGYYGDKNMKFLGWVIK